MDRTEFIRCGECHTDYRHNINLMTGLPVWMPPKPKRGESCKHPQEAAEVLYCGQWYRQGDELPSTDGAPDPASVIAHLDALREEHGYIISVDTCAHCGDGECDGLGCFEQLDPEGSLAGRYGEEFEDMQEMLRQGQAWRMLVAVVGEGEDPLTAFLLAEEALAGANNQMRHATCDACGEEFLGQGPCDQRCTNCRVLAARVAPEDRPAQCPNCGDSGWVCDDNCGECLEEGCTPGDCDCSLTACTHAHHSAAPDDIGLLKDFLLRITERTPETLADALEAVDRLAAGVPALDDDTRRDAHALVWALNGAPTALGPSSRKRIAELLAAAYLGGTDGR